MCTSRLHRVLSVGDRGTVVAEDLDGATHRVSLLALDPPGPVEPGEWLVVHSGYAIGRAEAAEGESAAALVRGAGR
jgi:hydrogenase expression/formation protein HypC